MQLPLRPQRVRSRGVDDRTRSRAVVVPVTIFEIGWVAELPMCRARLCVQALDDLFVAQPMEEHEALARDRRRRVASALGELPDRDGAFCQRLWFREEAGLRTDEARAEHVGYQALEDRAPRNERHGAIIVPLCRGRRGPDDRTWRLSTGPANWLRPVRPRMAARRFCPPVASR